MTLSNYYQKMPQKTKTLLIPLLLLPTLLSLLYHRTFIWLVNEWLTNLYYSHGFLIPPFSLFIAWLRRKEADEEDRKFKGASAILGFGLLILVIGFLYGMNVVVALSFIPVTIGVLLQVYPNKIEDNAFSCFVPLLCRSSTHRKSGLRSPDNIYQRIGIITEFSRTEHQQAGCTTGLKKRLVPRWRTLQWYANTDCLARSRSFARLFYELLSHQETHTVLFRHISRHHRQHVPNMHCTIIFAACLLGTNTALRTHELSSILLFGFALVIFISIAKILKCEVMVR